MEMNEEMQQKMEMVLNMCTCKSCPSWEECGEKGGFCFPAINKSTCISQEKGCICSGCPVTAQMGLKNIYFCTKGSEKEQTGM